MREVSREGYVCGGGPDHSEVSKEGFVNKMAIGRSSEALDIELFMFPSLAFLKRLEKKSSRMVEYGQRINTSDFRTKF